MKQSLRTVLATVATMTLFSLSLTLPATGAARSAQTPAKQQTTSSTVLSPRTSGTGSIAGTVTDASTGSVLAGICVTAQTVTGSPGGTATTSSNGTYTIAGLSADSYVVWFNDCSSVGNYVSQYYNATTGGTVLLNGASAVVVATGSAVTSINAAMAVGGSITGTVTDAASGSVVAGVCVSATSSSGYSVGSAPSASDGTYEITGLPADTYTVEFYGCSSSLGYIPQYYDGASTGSYTQAGATSVAVTVGATKSGIGAAMTSGGSITGTVTSASTGLAGICVYAESGGTLSSSAITSSTGTYTLAGLNAASYVVWFSSCNSTTSSYETQYYDGTASGTPNFASATAVNVTAGSTISSINAQMVLGGSITGIATDTSGNPISGLCVYASSTVGGFGASGVTAADGTYALVGLGSGSYVVQFNNCSSATDYALEYYNATPTGTTSYTSATAVNVIAGSTVSSVDAQLALGGSIAGTVTDSSGTPLAGICVNASSSDGSTNGSAQTTSAGTYTISGLAQASYTVQFTDCGSSGSYATQYYNGVAGGTGSYWSAVAVPVTANTTSSSINASMSAGGSITGTVTDGSGPLVGICVYAFSSAGGFGGSAITTSTGGYTINGLSSGDYTVGFNSCSGSSNYATEYYSTGGGTSSYFAASQVSVTPPNATSGINAQMVVGGSIAGTVTDGSGVALAGICANAWSSLGMFDGSSPTTSDGTYTINGLASGSYTVGFSSCTNSSNYVTEYYDGSSTGTTSYGSAKSVDVSAGGTTVGGINAEMTTGGSIAGTITDSSGNPVAGICAMAIAGSYGTGSAPSAADGTYRLNGLASGTYTVEFFDCASTGYAAEYYSGGSGGSSSMSNAALVPVTAGQTTSSINAVLAVGGSISGTVIDANGALVSGVCVDAFEPNGSFGSSATTAADGTYTITGLGAGSYDVQFTTCYNASSLNYVSQYYDGTPSGTTSYMNASTVPVTPGQTTLAINATMVLGGSISGTVIDSSSQGIAGICVDAFTTTTGEFAGFAMTAADGTYTLTGLESGTYNVQFTTCGNSSLDYTSQYYNGTVTGVLSSSNASSVSVTTGQTTPAINATMLLGGSISGTVTDSSSQGIAGICVNAITTSTGEFAGFAMTAADGTYTLTGLGAGTYNVQFTTCGNASLNYMSQYYNGSSTQSSASPVTVTAGQTTPGIDAAMVVGGSISGTVTDSSSQGIAGICVWASTPGSNFEFTATTASDGTYTISGLATGNYDVQFTTCGNTSLDFISQYYNGSSTLSTASPVTVAAGQTTQGVNAVMVPGGSISGTVSDSAGPLADICVTAMLTSGDFGGSATTAADGTYTITGLAAATYDVQFSNCGNPSLNYVSQNYTGPSALNGAVSVTLGQTLSGINATMADGGSFAGTVTDSSNGNGVQGICVYAFSTTGNFGGYATTGTNGTYTVTGLATGSYEVQFSDCNGTNYAAQYYDGAPSGTTVAASATPVSVTVGQTASGVDASMLLNQTITFTSTAPTNPPLGSTYTPTATATSGLTVTLSIDTSSTTVCSIGANNLVTFNAAGTCIVDANQAGNTVYAPATQVQQSIDPPAIAPAMRRSAAKESGLDTVQGNSLNGTAGVSRPEPRISLQSQVITFTSSAPSGATVGGTYTPTATTTSGLTVTFSIDTSSTSGTCSISAGSVSFSAVGTCIVDANQSGNATYASATTAQQSFTIGKGTQSINFVSTSPSNATVGGSPYDVTATASSGLTVQFAVDSTSTSGACSISGGIVTFNGLGTCVIDATQPGNANYSAAIEQQQSLVIGRGVQTITIVSVPPNGVTPGSAPYSVVAMATSRLPVSVSVDGASTPRTCSLSGTTVTFVGVGTCVIDANQSGDGDYSPASQVQQTITVTAAAIGPVVVPPPSVTQSPPPLIGGLSAANFGTPVTDVLWGIAPATVSLGALGVGGAAVSVAVSAGSLPPETVMSIYPITGTTLGSLLPASDQYVTAFAVSWVAPGGSSPAAKPPLTVTLTDASIVAGDAVYMVTSSGTVLAATATANGSVTVTFSGDPVFILASVPLAESTLSISTVVGTVQRPLTLSATGGSGTGGLNFTLVSSGSARCVLHGDVLIAHRAGSCALAVTKAASPGYLAATSTTATIKFTAAVITRPLIHRVVGAVRPGRTVLLRLLGSNFYGRPRVLGVSARMGVVVTRDSGKVLTLRVRAAANLPRGVDRWTLEFVRGQRVAIVVRVV